jgi:hypothetical protein
MNVKPADRPTAQECLQHPWLLKKTDEPIDENIAQNAIRTLRRFRVNIILIKNYLGGSKAAASCSYLHSMPATI